MHKKVFPNIVSMQEATESQQFNSFWQLFPYVLI